MTKRQITAATADEKIKQLYEMAFPEDEQIPWKDLMLSLTASTRSMAQKQSCSAVSNILKKTARERRMSLPMPSNMISRARIQQPVGAILLY